MLALKESTSNGTSEIARLTAFANRFERQRSGAIGVITSVAAIERRGNEPYAPGFRTFIIRAIPRPLFKRMSL